MNEARIHIVQGEFATGTSKDVSLTTLLGSCVSCCLWDPHAMVGGMNHMLLTRSSSDKTARALSGINAMELLINELIKLGARKDRLQAKAFGGARMIDGLSDIGVENAEFTVSYLAQERIPLVIQSFGGRQARILRFWPATGRALQKLTDTRASDVERPVAAPIGHGLELF
jgi:chemotaxis protein CheD